MFSSTLPQWVQVKCQHSPLWGGGGAGGLLWQLLGWLSSACFSLTVPDVLLKSFGNCSELWKIMLHILFPHVFLFLLREKVYAVAGVPKVFSTPMVRGKKLNICRCIYIFVLYVFIFILQRKGTICVSAMPLFCSPCGYESVSCCHYERCTIRHSCSVFHCFPSGHVFLRGSMLVETFSRLCTAWRDEDKL